MMLVFNWKSYLSIHESRELAAMVANHLLDEPLEHELIIAPSHLAIHDVRYHLQGSPVQLATQGISQEKDLGAYTAQIPAMHIQSLDISAAIIGHSEMRQYLGHTNQMIHKQLAVCYDASIMPIICVGETEEEKQAGRTEQVVVEQVHEILAGQEVNKSIRTIFAYEPRWAIGTGKSENPENANQVHELIKRTAAEYGLNEVEVLYGGSIKPSTIDGFLRQEHIDGCIIGGASTEFDYVRQFLSL